MKKPNRQTQLHGEIRYFEKLGKTIFSAKIIILRKRRKERSYLSKRRLRDCNRVTLRNSKCHNFFNSNKAQSIIMKFLFKPLIEPSLLLSLIIAAHHDEMMTMTFSLNVFIIQNRYLVQYLRWVFFKRGKLEPKLVL